MTKLLTNCISLQFKDQDLVAQTPTRVAAEVWFTEERVQLLAEKFGAAPTLTWYDTLVTVDYLKEEVRVNGVSQTVSRAAE